MTYRCFTIMMIVLGFSGSASAAEPSLQALKEKCQAAREAKLGPEREALIQTCVKKEQKPEEECRRFYADYGAGGRTAGGAGRPPLYFDLPECVELSEAEQKR
ncbi:hypothetical protein [Thiolapillus sp.]|uniref:hypothetical protein n=6 Tax=Thiolapillus sp. TaxID=2017437 RepID=UPI0025DEE573|nr:hypothetical protein [Thiolapillus sp.]